MGPFLCKAELTTLERAKQFKASDFVAAALGKDVQAHYARFFQNEAQAYAAAVTDWEQKRYFELI